MSSALLQWCYLTIKKQHKKYNVYTFFIQGTLVTHTCCSVTDPILQQKYSILSIHSYLFYLSHLTHYPLISLLPTHAFTTFTSQHLCNFLQINTNNLDVGVSCRTKASNERDEIWSKTLIALFTLYQILS